MQDVEFEHLLDLDVGIPRIGTDRRGAWIDKCHVSELPAVKVPAALALERARGQRQRRAHTFCDNTRDSAEQAVSILPEQNLAKLGSAGEMTDLCRRETLLSAIHRPQPTTLPLLVSLACSHGLG